MTDTAAAELRKTPLHARHRAANARMVPFAGWDMPVEYSGITDEHLAVRTRAGVFDVSHMGEIEIAGKNALAAVQCDLVQRRQRAADRPGAVLGAADAGRHVRGRHARLPHGAEPLHARRQRREHREGLRLDQRADQSRRAMPRRSTRAAATR